MMGSPQHLTTVLLSPPGPAISRPSPSDPRPANNPPTFTDAMTVRNIVFVEEQGCSPDTELDEDDPRSWHWVLYDTAREHHLPVGVIRLVPPPHAPHYSGENSNASRDLMEQCQHQQPYVKLTRVGLLPAYRGSGLGRFLVDLALEWAANHPCEVSAALTTGERWTGLVLVHAQVQVEEVYARMGFVTDNSMGRWIEEGIAHVGMWKSVKVL